MRFNRLLNTLYNTIVEVGGGGLEVANLGDVQRGQPILQRGELFHFFTAMQIFLF